MKKALLISILISACIISSFGQARLIIPPGITMPKDSTITNKLTASLTGFLNNIDAGATTNQFIAANDKIQTLDLIDEIKEIQQSQKYKDNNFYKPYLTNVVKLTDTTYFIQLSFIGIADSIAIPRASFDLMGYTSKVKGFSFGSPIAWYTRYWKKEKIGNITFHYKDNLNIPKATDYSKYVLSFDRKLGIDNEVIEYYCCNDAAEALHILGVANKSDYSSRKNIGLSASADKSSVIVSSNSGEQFNNFDPHDLWHDRRNKVMPATLINRPVDEGCAYLYGGSWGLTWKEVYSSFENKLAKNRQANWLDLYENKYNFADSVQYELLAGYVINALIVQKLEKEKGFAPVAELLKCGAYEKGNENYFTALNKLTGINKQNFNEEVWKLIDQESK